MRFPPLRSLADLPRFQMLDHKLPARALARLYIDPRLAESLLKNSPGPRSPGEALIERYVGALESAGAALVVGEGHLALHTAEVFEPRKFRELIGSATAVQRALVALPRHAIRMTKRYSG